VELPIAIERYEKGHVEIIPVLLYPTNLERIKPFLHFRNPLPSFGKTWRCIERESGDWKDALFPIGRGLEQVIERVVAKKKMSKRTKLASKTRGR
jgi:hypothetical protein